MRPTRRAPTRRSGTSRPSRAARIAVPRGPGGAPEGIAIGDPDDIVEAIKRWESIGVDGLNFILNADETIPQQEVLDSLRLFASEVMPKFENPARTVRLRTGS